MLGGIIGTLPPSMPSSAIVSLATASSWAQASVRGPGRGGAVRRMTGGFLEDSAQHVSNLNADVVQWQYRLLEPDERDRLRAREPANAAERRTRLSATRRKLEHAASQSRAQATVARSHVRKANKFMVEYHKKLAIPFACLVFALLGVASAAAAPSGLPP